MPRLSSWYIRIALLYLALGFTLGGLLLFNKGFPLHSLIWSLLPVHIESVLIGWTLQLVMGMAFWILPRFQKAPVRGNEALAVGAFILINIGILSIVLASFLPGMLWLAFVGRTAEAAGVIAFIVHAWPRIKGFGGS